MTGVQSGAKHTLSFAERNAEECLIYIIFSVIATCGALLLSDLVFSALITLSAACQSLGFALLLMQVVRKRKCMSISVRSLYLYLVALCCRLSATCRFNGYLPVDRTGDHVYQLIEILSVMIVAVTIWRVTKQQRLHNFDRAPVDNCNISVIVAACAIVAWMVHPQLNNKTAPDVAWAMALYVETVAMVPQLWLLTKAGGEVDSLQGHYIACTFASRVLMMRFWVSCYKELKPKEAEVNLPGMGVIGSQLLQCVLFADFMYLYFKSIRYNQTLSVPMAMEV
jgi:hypothetical protein